MLDIKEANRFIIFIFLLLLFIAATNNYTSIENSMIDGFSDQKHYLNIINDSPSFTIQEIAKYQSERFFFPYVIGALINFFKLNQISYEIFIFLNIAVFFLILSLFIKLLNFENSNINLNNLLVLSFACNPYIFRAGIYAPLMINDYIFILGIILFLFFLLHGKINFLTTSVLICSFSRQTALLMLPVLFFYLYFEKINSREKIYILFNIVILIFIFYFNKYISSFFNVKIDESLIKTVTGLFKFNYTFLELILFIARFFISNFFIIILLFFTCFNLTKVKRKIKIKHWSILILGLLIWSQPILGGPIFTGGNIQRLTSFSIPIFLILFSYIYKDIKLGNLNYYLIFVLMIISSFDHRYSFLGRLEIFTNANYLQSIIIIFISIILILKNKLILKS